MPQTLQLTGKLSPIIGQRFERLYFNHGSGNQKTVLVGHSSGEKFYKYVYLAPDRSTHVVSDPENGGASTTWADYLIAFHRYRMVDGEAFNVTDQLTGSTVLVMFSDESAYQFQFLMEGKTVFGAELYLRQYRAP